MRTSTFRLGIFTYIGASVPPNLTFYIDDIEDQWTFSYKFDMIYARMMTGSIRDWPKFIQQSYE